jgi:opacity protein-like surface antigen
MKYLKTIALAGLLLLTAVPAVSATTVRVGLFGGYQTVTDATFKEIYSSGGTVFGGGLGIGFGPGLEARLEASFLSFKGKTTLTQEDSTFTLTPLSAGLRYYFLPGLLRPYAGAGLAYCLYKETGPERFEAVSGTSLGFMAEAGLCVEIGRLLYVDANARYISASAKPFDESFNIGGLRGGIGLGVRF